MTRTSATSSHARTPFFHFCHGDLRYPRALPGYELLFVSEAAQGPGLFRVFRRREAPR